VKTPIHTLLSIVLLTISPAGAQEPADETSGTSPAVSTATTDPAEAGPATATQIIGSLSDGTPPQLSPPKPPLELEVLKTLAKPIVLEEPAPLSGMKSVRKTVTLTKHLIVEPDLPEPPPPLPPVDITDPAVIARLAEMRDKFRKTEIVFVSATVYDHSRTFVRWWPNGQYDKEMCAWSNVDFNLFCGFSDYTWQGRKFSLLMGIGNENAALRQHFASMRGRTYTPPEIPALPTDGPGFVLTKGDAADPASLDVLTGLHELYRVEETRLKDAYAGREKARIEREAFLRAHPPQPKDVTTWISEACRLDAPSVKTLTR